MKIITRYDPKPIPVRSFDWSARDENYDMDDPVGYGATEQEAIAELKELIEFASPAGA